MRGLIEYTNAIIEISSNNALKAEAKCKELIKDIYRSNQARRDEWYRTGLRMLKRI